VALCVSVPAAAQAKPFPADFKNQDIRIWFVPDAGH
jgi:hypothetical protein